MKTIAMINRKGGVGKTTSALLLASAIQHAGFPVAIDDRDPQGSATALAPAMGLSLGSAASVVISDTAPSLVLPGTISAIRNADVCLVLTSPSPVDMATTAETIKVVLQHRAADRTRVLFNNLQSGTRLAGMVGHLRATLPILSLTNCLGRRQAYQLCQLGGGWKDLPPLARDEVLRIALEIMAMA